MMMRLAVWAPGPIIEEADVATEMPELKVVNDGILSRELGLGFDLGDVIGEVVGHYFDRALRESDGTLARAAELTGFEHYQTFSNWLERYGEWITYERE